LKQLWPKLLQEQVSPTQLMTKYGLVVAPIEKVRESCLEVWRTNAKIVQDLLAGKDKVRGSLIGPIKKLLDGKVDNQLINQILD
jgi:Asp-tRNA(Asn)/Glu-tRNA(Gln) amidotransferase B subunit